MYTPEYTNRKMHSTKPQGNDLKIELAAPPHWTFAPGDTVIGTVVRRNHLVTPKATLDLRLTGHTQTKIDDFVAGYAGYGGYPGYGPHPMPGAVGRQHGAYWNLLPTWKANVLWNDTLHISPDDDDNWSVPFEVPIPVSLEKEFLRRHHHAEESYLPVDAHADAHDETSLATQVLPGSFLARRPYDPSAGNGGCEGSIVYKLEATLRYTHGGSPTTIKASCPVTLRHISQHPPAYNDSKHDGDSGSGSGSGSGSDKLAHRCSYPVTVQTHRLNPALQDERAHLSFSQKTQQFFGTSKVPQFTYRVEFGMPRTVSLSSTLREGNDSSTFPLTLAIVPDSHPHKTSPALHGNTQTFQVRSMRISLDAVTEVRATGGGGKGIRTAHHVYPHAVFVSMSSSSSNVVELIASDEKSVSKVDIGSLLGLRLGPNGLLRRGMSSSAGARSAENGARVNALYPDFTSFLIKHSHKLSCEVEVRVAGESVKVHSAMSVVVT